MTDLVHLISVYADRPVIDKSGLDGEYDYSIEWSTTSGDFKLGHHGGSAGATRWKYEAAKEPVDVLVIGITWTSSGKISSVAGPRGIAGRLSRHPEPTLESNPEPSSATAKLMIGTKACCW